jgi:hypothetical protein
MFPTYIILLDNKNIFENLRIKTRNSIANIYWNLTTSQLFATDIICHFKVAIEFPRILNIEEFILKRALYQSHAIMRELAILFDNRKKS